MATKIGVLIKYVPDTNAQIQMKEGQIDESSLKYVMNPYDEFAVEEAVRTKEAWTKEGIEAEIVGVLLGPKEAVKALRDSFAVGIDRGIHILDESKAANDPKSISTALASACREETFDLLFAGKQAVDTDSHATAQMVAERLGIPHVGVVSECEFVKNESVRLTRDVEGGMKEIFTCKLPVLITANKGLNKMRLAPLPAIRRASQKEVKEVPLPAVSSGLKVVEWTLPPERSAVKMIEGDPAAQANELIRVLREEAKVI